MIGKFLTYDIRIKSGTILANDGRVYTFNRADWKDNIIPKIGMKVDFDSREANRAVVIYAVQDTSNQVSQDTRIALGVVALFLTFFFSFIGTFISRILLSRDSIGSIIVSTLIHFVITILALIPFLGWIIYILGTVYYMYRNFVLVTKPHQIDTRYNKYA